MGQLFSGCFQVVAPWGTLIEAGRNSDVDGGQKRRRGAIEVGCAGWVKDSRNAL